MAAAAGKNKALWIGGAIAVVVIVFLFLRARSGGGGVTPLQPAPASPTDPNAIQGLSSLARVASDEAIASINAAAETAREQAAYAAATIESNNRLQAVRLQENAQVNTQIISTVGNLIGAGLGYAFGRGGNRSPSYGPSSYPGSYPGGSGSPNYGEG